MKTFRICLAAEVSNISRNVTSLAFHTTWKTSPYYQNENDETNWKTCLIRMDIVALTVISFVGHSSNAFHFSADMQSVMKGPKSSWHSNDTIQPTPPQPYRRSVREPPVLRFNCVFPWAASRNHGRCHPRPAWRAAPFLPSTRCTRYFRWVVSVSLYRCASGKCLHRIDVEAVL